MSLIQQDTQDKPIRKVGAESTESSTMTGRSTISTPSFHKKQREYRWDTIKFFMMLFVVYGHMLYYFLGDNIIAQGIYCFIYSFHIPVFIFISGMFSIPVLYKKDWNKPVRYLFLYCLMKTMLAAVKSLKTGKMSIHYFWDDTPSWFFLAIAVYLILTMMLRPRLGTRKMLLYALFFACIAGYDNHLGDHFASMRIATFYPFFLAGIYYREMAMQGRISKETNPVQSLLYKVVSGILLGGMFVGMFMNGAQCYPYINFLKGKVTFAKVGLQGLNGFFFRGIYFLITFLLIFCIIQLAPKRNNIFAALGRYTLFVYLIHPLGISWFFVVNNGAKSLRNVFPSTVIVMLFFTAGIITILLSMLGMICMRYCKGNKIKEAV